MEEKRAQKQHVFTCRNPRKSHLRALEPGATANHSRAEDLRQGPIANRVARPVRLQLSFARELGELQTLHFFSLV